MAENQFYKWHGRDPSYATESVRLSYTLGARIFTLGPRYMLYNYMDHVLCTICAHFA